MKNWRVMLMILLIGSLFMMACPSDSPTNPDPTKGRVIAEEFRGTFLNTDIGGVDMYLTLEEKRISNINMGSTFENYAWTVGNDLFDLSHKTRIAYFINVDTLNLEATGYTFHRVSE